MGTHWGHICDTLYLFYYITPKVHCGFWFGDAIELFLDWSLAGFGLGSWAGLGLILDWSCTGFGPVLDWFWAGLGLGS